MVTLFWGAVKDTMGFFDERSLNNEAGRWGFVIQRVLSHVCTGDVLDRPAKLGIDGEKAG